MIGRRTLLDRLTQAQIAQRMGRDKSRVWRRRMLVESLEDEVQSHVRLGLLGARAAVAVREPVVTW